MTMKMQRKATWKPIPEWEGFYEVSDRGEVRSVDRIVHLSNGQTRSYRGRLVRPQKTSNGYLHVQLRRPGKTQICRVHQLVLRAFVGPAPEGHEACHLNANRHDNRLANLRWDDRSGNQLDRVRHGHHHYASRDRCNEGHLYTPENTIYRKDSSGGRARRCRTCHNKAMRESRKRSRQITP